MPEQGACEGDQDCYRFPPKASPHALTAASVTVFLEEPVRIPSYPMNGSASLIPAGVTANSLSCLSWSLPLIFNTASAFRMEESISTNRRRIMQSTKKLTPISETGGGTPTAWDASHVKRELKPRVLRYMIKR